MRSSRIGEAHQWSQGLPIRPSCEVAIAAQSPRPYLAFRLDVAAAGRLIPAAALNRYESVVWTHHDATAVVSSRARDATGGTMAGAPTTKEAQPPQTAMMFGPRSRGARRSAEAGPRILQRVSCLGMLAGGIAHELNNALTPILNYAKLGIRNPDPEYRRRAFERILEGAERASAITGGVLGLARPGSVAANRRTWFV